MSFKSAWRCCGAVLRLHDKQCKPLEFTSFPHGQVYSSHVRSPRLKPTAIRIISSLNLKPIDVIGGAISQSPEWGGDADRLRALSTSEESLISCPLVGCQLLVDPTLFSVCAGIGQQYWDTWKTCRCRRRVAYVMVRTVDESRLEKDVLKWECWCYGGQLSIVSISCLTGTFSSTLK